MLLYYQVLFGDENSENKFIIELLNSPKFLENKCHCQCDLHNKTCSVIDHEMF